MHSEHTIMLKKNEQHTQPERLYHRCGKLVPVFALISAVILIGGLVWGFGFAPADYQQGQGYRIMYLHVPAAVWSMGVYVVMAIFAVWALSKRSETAEWAIAAMAPVGAVFTFIALTTGSTWGKPMWGTWWVWDARLTSELVLLFIYIGVIALYNAFDDRRLAGRAMAIMVLVGVVNLPIIHFSVEWWNTLHQGSTKMQKTLDPAMRLPLRVMMLGFMSLFVTLSLMRLRNLILMQQRRTSWVAALINKGEIA